MVSILVVDDEPTVRFMLSRIIDRYGYSSTAASSVTEAKELLAARSFELVLTDIKMPGEEGLELIRHVRDNFPETGVVVVTMIDDPVEAREILELGVYGYIIKPFTPNIVYITIENALRRHQLEMQEKVRVESLQQEVLLQTESVREQVRFLQTLIDSIPIPVYYKNRESRYIGCNKAYAEIVGHSQEEILGRTAKDIFPPEFGDYMISQDQQLLRDGGSVYAEVDLTNRRGAVHPVILQKASFQDSNGEIAGIVGIGLDISELKDVEKSLRESEEKLRSIMDNLPVGVILTDREKKKVLQVNSLILKWFPGVMEDNSGLIDHGVGMGCVKNWSGAGYEDEEIEKHATPDGDLIFRTAVSPVFAQDGRLSSFVKIFEDITRKQAIERELRQAQKLESIGQLAAGIAHEINTPMQYIGDNLNFISEACVDIKVLYDAYADVYQKARELLPREESVERMAEAIENLDPDYLMEEIPLTISQSLEGVKRVSNIVRAMRDFSHPGSDDKVFYDINHAIESTVVVSRNEWKYISDVETDLDPSLPQLLCFPGEINQVFLNIIINSAHAIEAKMKSENGIEKKGTIKITTGMENDFIKVEITDSGTGIPAEVRNRVFDPFFTTKEVGKGTGQGLAIARSVIVDKHQGQLFFTTEENKGTSFVMKLPLL